VNILDVRVVGGSPSVHLLNGDLLVGGLRGLWYDDLEDAVLQAGLHAVLIDAGWKREAAMEFTNGAFADPELGLVGSLLDFLVVVVGGGNFCGSSAFVFDGGLVGFVFLLFVSLGDLALVIRWTGLVAGFGVTGDGEGVAVGPFDVYVLLLDARELTMERISILCLADIEFRLEGAQLLHLAWEAAAGEVGIIVHQPKDRRDFAVEVAWEERHLGWCGVESVCSIGALGDAEGFWDLSSKCWSKH
jgi:hypothetical protein